MIQMEQLDSVVDDDTLITIRRFCGPQVADRFLIQPKARVKRWSLFKLLLILSLGLFSIGKK